MSGFSSMPPIVMPATNKEKVRDLNSRMRKGQNNGEMCQYSPLSCGRYISDHGVNHGEDRHLATTDECEDGGEPY